MLPIKLAAVTLPVALINPGVNKLPPVMLAVKFALPITFPDKLVVPPTSKLLVCKLAYPVMLIVVLVSLVLVKAVTNSELASFHTNAILFAEPRSPRKPMSTVGAPICVLASTMTGSSIVVIVVSIAVLVPLTVRFPETVRSEP